jgi:DNA-binding PadR family transcriptional regulator
MGRIFGRGELKQAVLVVLASLGTAHGYAIMGELKDRVGQGWKPSPGAIYPALLALVERGLVETTEEDGTRMYSLTASGRREARSLSVAERWADLSARAASGEQRVTVGSLLDAFAADSDVRRRLPDADQRGLIASILERASAEIEQAMNQGENHG